MNTPESINAKQRGPASHTQRLAAALAVASVVFTMGARADEVTDWNSYTEQACNATAQSPALQGRFFAIAHAAIYDAVNGIRPKYTPYFVKERAPEDASPQAAAVQAGYTVLVALLPSQKATLDLQRASSLAKIPGNAGRGRPLKLGLAWGEHVANEILAWRSNDGLSTPLPPYFGGGAPGIWRSPPSGTNADGTLPAIVPQNAILVPFTMTSHDQFRPGPPPALTSALYAADVNEVKAIGRFDSPLRTPDQTQLAFLWQAVGASAENNAIRPVVESHLPKLSLVDTARIFALINFAAEDGIIAGFDCKYTYNLWRPYHAIRLADTDGNPDTEADPTWDSLVTAPRHQEYMSNHATVTTAFMNTLAELLGDEHTFTLSAPGYPNFTWTFSRLSDSAIQAREARIWAGIHYRNSCNVGAAQGMKISRQALDHFLLPLHGDDARD